MGVTGAHDEVRDHDALEKPARAGLVAFGVVHVLIAWISLQVAWGGGGGEASAGGALRELADKPFGEVLLWIAGFGLAALTVWQLATSVWGYATEEGMTRLRKRLSSLGRAVVYAVLAFSCFRLATGSGGGSGGDAKEEGLTADLLAAPFGRAVVVAVAVGILVVAGRMVYRGVSDNFTHDLTADATTGRGGSVVLWAGRTGYVAKGAAVGIVGALFGWAALSYDPDKAGGLDDALKTLRDQPYGPVLLTAVALGIAAFGVFCFAWARHMRQR